MIVHYGPKKNYLTAVIHLVMGLTCCAASMAENNNAAQVLNKFQGL